VARGEGGTGREACAHFALSCVSAIFSASSSRLRAAAFCSSALTSACAACSFCSSCSMLAELTLLDYGKVIAPRMPVVNPVAAVAQTTGER
jgi:hypothetical protein